MNNIPLHFLKSCFRVIFILFIESRIDEFLEYTAVIAIHNVLKKNKHGLHFRGPLYGMNVPLLLGASNCNLIYTFCIIQWHKGLVD
jgi:hypothetical protein